MKRSQVQVLVAPHTQPRGLSSVGRAPALQAGCQEFESPRLHRRRSAGPPGPALLVFSTQYGCPPKIRPPIGGQSVGSKQKTPVHPFFLALLTAIPTAVLGALKQPQYVERARSTGEGEFGMHWSWLRLAAAAVGLSGVVAGFIVNVDRATRQGQDLGLVLANYFSLFTIITTILTVAALTVAAMWTHAASRTRRGSRSGSRSASPWSPARCCCSASCSTCCCAARLRRGARRPRRDRVPGLLRHRDAARRAAALPPRRPALRDTASRAAVVDASRCSSATRWSGSSTRCCAASSRPTPRARPRTGTRIRSSIRTAPADGTGAFTYIGVLLVALVAIGAVIIAIGRFRERRAAARRERDAPQVRALQA